MNMSNTVRSIAFNKLEDRIMELLFRAETFINWSHELCKLYEINTDNSKKLFITMHINLYFAEALTCAHSLLFGNTINEKEELSIGYLYKKYGFKLKKAGKPFKEIRDEYQQMRLHIIRHQFIAHKDLINIGDPVVGFLNHIKKKHITNLEKILIETKKHLYDILPDPSANNYFLSLYQPSFDYLTSSLDKW